MWKTAKKQLALFSIVYDNCSENCLLWVVCSTAFISVLKC